MGQGRAFAYPKRYAVLSLRLDTAFMFPADAQPEGEAPTHTAAPAAIPFLPLRRARPAGGPARIHPTRKGPAPFGAGP